MVDTERALEYPAELLNIICCHVYYSTFAPEQPTLDPLFAFDNTASSTPVGAPCSFPSALPPAHWSEPTTRRTLKNLCLVNHDWYQAAKPWLWRNLEVRLPRGWLTLVEEVAWEFDEETVDQVMENTVKAATQSALLTRRIDNTSDEDASKSLRESILESLATPMPDESIPFELLSPFPSREPSPRRFRHKSQSPARWELMRSISDAIQLVMRKQDPNVYVPTTQDSRPGRFVRHLDFNHFRTIGMRRSVEEGVNSRFVTGERVEAVLKETPNLVTFGATEYMDGALTYPVLSELFLRGAPSRGRGRNSRGRSMVDVCDFEEEARERRRQCLDLEAIDLTGCVSAVFVAALTEFVNVHIIKPDGGDDVRRGRAEEPLSFPGLQRLGLRGVKSILPNVLRPFVLSFPSLTHLDLSATRVTPELLFDLGHSQTVRLKSLALSRCVRLTSESIRDLLVDCAVTSEITELNLFGDHTFSSPITEEDLETIVTKAPCFTSGRLVYLDLSSSPVTEHILVHTPSQSSLRSLGLSFIPDLGIESIAAFVEAKAKNVEVLTLLGTSPELSCGLRAGDALPLATATSTRQSCIALHTHLIQPLCCPPFSLSLTAPKPVRTRLRVVELATCVLAGLGGGGNGWKTIRSKGGRGWYVDTACGWVHKDGASVLQRGLAPEHPLRQEYERLAGANGNVGSGVGWHARKMEILRGNGMLGREDGLYGAVSFAYLG